MRIQQSTFCWLIVTTLSIIQRSHR